MAGQGRLRKRFERAQAEGDLPETAKPDALAAFVMTVTQGIAVQAKAGLSRAMLEAVAEQALATWPAANAPSSRPRRPRRKLRPSVRGATNYPLPQPYLPGGYARRA